jgi:hypothetical protein
MGRAPCARSAAQWADGAWAAGPGVGWGASGPTDLHVAVLAKGRADTLSRSTMRSNSGTYIWRAWRARQPRTSGFGVGARALQRSPMRPPKDSVVVACACVCEVLGMGVQRAGACLVALGSRGYVEGEALAAQDALRDCYHSGLGSDVLWGITVTLPFAGALVRWGAALCGEAGARGRLARSARDPAAAPARDAPQSPTAHRPRLCLSPAHTRVHTGCLCLQPGSGAGSASQAGRTLRVRHTSRQL